MLHAFIPRAMSVHLCCFIFFAGMATASYAAEASTAHLSEDGTIFYDTKGREYVKEGDQYYDHSNGLVLTKSATGIFKDGYGNLYGQVKPGSKGYTTETVAPTKPTISSTPKTPGASKSPSSYQMAGRTLTTQDGGKTYILELGNSVTSFKFTSEADLLAQVQKFNNGVNDTRQTVMGQGMQNGLLKGAIAYYQDVLAGKYDDQPWAADEKLTAKANIDKAQKQLATNRASIESLVGKQAALELDAIPAVNMADYGNPSKVVGQAFYGTMIKGAGYAVADRSITSYDGETYIMTVDGKNIQLKTKVGADNSGSMSSALKQEIQQLNRTLPDTIQKTQQMVESRQSAMDNIAYQQQILAGAWDGQANAAEMKAKAPAAIAQLQQQMTDLEKQLTEINGDDFLSTVPLRK